MRKKIALCFLFALTLFCLTACKNNTFRLADRIIEKRENLFTAYDKLYSVSLSTGIRENDYNFDGIVNEMVPFAILSFSRLDNLPLASDSYAFIVSIGEQSYTGFLEKSNNDNSYSSDLEIAIDSPETINVGISFTGYSFNKDLEKTSSSFQVDCDAAVKITEKELKDSISAISNDQNNKIEVVMKILKDFSSEELKNYYWYVGIIANNGETLGILIDANSGNIIAKKS